MHTVVVEKPIGVGQRDKLVPKVGEFLLEGFIGRRRARRDAGADDVGDLDAQRAGSLPLVADGIAAAVTEDLQLGDGAVRARWRRIP